MKPFFLALLLTATPAFAAASPEVARWQAQAARVSITRDDFERWIARDVSRIAATVDQALAAACMSDPMIDHVFLTGGSAYVPAVRRIFESRFGAGRLAGGGEFTSVAEGLALMAA